MTLVSQTNEGSTASASSITSTAQAHAAGSLLVVFVQAFSTSADISSISNTAGDSWSRIGRITGASVGATIMYYAFDVVGHGSDQITANLNGSYSYRTISVLEFSGFGAADPWVNSSGTGNSGNDASPDTGANVPVNTSDSLVAAFVSANNDSVSNSNGYTYTSFNATGDGTPYYASGYKEVSAAEHATANCSSGLWTILAASFTIPASGAPLPVVMNQYRQRVN